MPMGKISFGSGIEVPSKAFRFSKAKSAYLNQPSSPKQVKQDSTRKSRYHLCFFARPMPMPQSQLRMMEAAMTQISLGSPQA